MAPFGASRAGLMSVVGDDIPDSDAYRYLMDEGSGDMFNDTSSGDTVDATHKGGWNSRLDAIGGFAATFNGTDEFAQTDDDVPVNGDEFTAVAWIEPDSLHRGGIFATTDDPSALVENGYYVELRSDGDIQAVNAENDNRNPIAVVSEGYNADEFIFVSVTGNGDETNLYVWEIDSQLGTASGSAGRSETSTRFTFGAFDSNWFSGEFSYSQSWTEEKSESELGEIWEQTRGRHQ